jgi:hypothetical protein
LFAVTLSGIRHPGIQHVVSLFSLFGPKWKHPRPEVRAVAAAALKDQATLAELAESDPSDDVRRVALERLTDQDHLARIARISTHPFNAEALHRVTVPKLIAEVARRAETPGIRALAVKRIDDPDTLHQISTADLDPDVRRQAKAKRLQVGVDPVRELLKSVLSKLDVTQLSPVGAHDFDGDLDQICTALMHDARFRVHGIVEEDQARAPAAATAGSPAESTPASAATGRSYVELLAGKIAGPDDGRDAPRSAYFHIRLWRDGPASFHGRVEEKSMEKSAVGGTGGEFLLGTRQ